MDDVIDANVIVDEKAVSLTRTFTMSMTRTVPNLGRPNDRDADEDDGECEDEYAHEGRRAC